MIVASKRFLLDALSVGIAGTRSAQGRCLIEFGHAVPEGREATVLGTGLRAGCSQAAFVNGGLIRSLELEETYEDTMMHAAPATIGAILALIEREGCSGKAVLSAVAVGYEVSQRVGSALSPSLYERGFHPTGVCGALGAVAAAARLMRLSEGETEDAMSFAASQAAGLMRGQSPAWRFLTCISGGAAARLGVDAATWARYGMRGGGNVFAGLGNFLDAHADEVHRDALTTGLGHSYLMLDGGLKLFPSSRFTHGGITAALELRADCAIDLDDIESVVVKGSMTAMLLSDKPEPESGLDAQGSQQYTVATALARGEFTLDDLTLAALARADVGALMRKVRVIVDEQLEADRRSLPGSWPTIVEIHRSNGTVIAKRVDFPLGSAGNPAPPELLRRKHMALASSVLGDERAESLLMLVEGIDDQEDAGSLASAYIPSV